MTLPGETTMDAPLALIYRFFWYAIVLSSSMVHALLPGQSSLKRGVVGILVLGFWGFFFGGDGCWGGVWFGFFVCLLAFHIPNTRKTSLKILMRNFRKERI